MSKVYEKVISTAEKNYIEKSIYIPTPSGFRKGHSTATLLLKFRNDIRKALNRTEITISVLIDYFKAFDTINHKTLLQKLVSFNFGVLKEVSWVQFYSIYM